jgi:hypothetical protein
MSQEQHRWAIDAVSTTPSQARNSPPGEADNRDDPVFWADARIVTLPSRPALRVGLLGLTASSETGFTPPGPGFTLVLCLEPAMMISLTPRWTAR